ncbi:MAG: plasmid pRiA4b ORF-3 family protein [Spirochaetia bacterium]|jgi:hypothetical protein|nr:plasmid pRiA4b ORF-3 family protein [Spirochaetia bacterium]
MLNRQSGEDLLYQQILNCRDFHNVLQTVMGWTNTHLHQFIIAGKFYTAPDDESYLEYIDYRKVKLNQVLSGEEESIIYEYDFGDEWEHKIVLEKILQNHIQKYPSCLTGKRTCPPEDCGGPYGYKDLIKVISDKNNEKYAEMIEWLGENFDPEYINIEEINEMLKEKDYGCISLN